MSMTANSRDRNRQSGGDSPGHDVDDLSIDRPRLTPQNRTGDEPAGEDSTKPIGQGARQGQSDKAEG